MRNKYLYTFMKDKSLQFRLVLFIVAVGLCVGFWRLTKKDAKDLQALQTKQLVCLEVPRLQAQLARLEASDGLLLNGIIFNKEKPLAVINDKVVAEGDVIENKKVASIKESSITLCDNATGEKCVELLLDQQP